MTTRFKPWMCTSCGYTMDEVSAIGEVDKAPKEGDASLCMNCGAIHILHDNLWRPVTPAEYNAMSEPDRLLIKRVQDARRIVIPHDLTKRDSRT